MIVTPDAKYVPAYDELHALCVGPLFPVAPQGVNIAFIDPILPPPLLPPPTVIPALIWMVIFTYAVAPAESVTVTVSI